MPASYAVVSPVEVEQAGRRLQNAFRCYRGPGFSCRFWDGSVWSSPGEQSTFTIDFKSRAAWNRFLASSDERVIADLFITGEIDVEGNLYGAIRSCRAMRNAIAGNWAPLVRLMRRSRRTLSKAVRSFVLFDRSNSGQSEIVAHEVRLGRPYNFFHPWLGKSMVFAVAFFRTFKEDLDAAQESGTDRVCRQLQLRPGDRFLDLSCDWGSLLMHAVNGSGVSGHGFSQSKEQVAAVDFRIAAAGKTAQCNVQMASHRDLAQIKLPFDRVAAVGFSEHVSVRDLADYFKNVYGATGQGGLFLCDFVTAEIPYRSDLESVAGVAFAEDELPTLHEIVRRAEEAGFSVVSVEELNDHYEETLRLWFRGLTKHRHDLARMSDLRTLRSWELCLACSAESVRAGHTAFHRLLLRRPISTFLSSRDLAQTNEHEGELRPLPYDLRMSRKDRIDDGW